MLMMDVCFFFFFQAEDGIRDVAVTGVQTCALPILSRRLLWAPPRRLPKEATTRRPYGRVVWRAGNEVTWVVEHLTGDETSAAAAEVEIGRASCRERVGSWGGGGSWKEKWVTSDKRQ